MRTLFAVMAVLALSGCKTMNDVAHGAASAAVGSVGVPSYTGSGGGMPTAQSGPSRGPDDDEHWFQPDDYLISDRAFGGQGYIYVTLAKMRVAPTATSKNEAQFFRIHDGKDIWTAHWWKTRPATQADLALGNEVICFEGHSKDGAYRGPSDKDNARGSHWFLGRITDTSDLYKGMVKVANYHCTPDALRVAVR